MDDKTLALKNLHDIHLPDPISIWPLAPGWYLLISLICISIITTFIILWQSRSHRRVQKQALQLLESYKKSYAQEANSQKTCALVNELLKKVAMFYYPRSHIAALSGEKWINFLNQTLLHQTIFNRLIKRQKLKPTTFSDCTKEILIYPYQASQHVDLEILFKVTKNWIKNQRKLTNKEKL